MTEKILYSEKMKSDFDFPTIQYGIHSLLNETIKLLSVLVISVVFYSNYLSLVIYMAFALFKMTAGGYHFKKYTYCYLFTVISIVAIETYALSMLGIPNFVILLHATDYIYIFLFLPKPTGGRRLTKSRVSKSRIYLLVYSLICQFLIIISPHNVFFVSIYLGYKVAFLTSLSLGGKNEFAHL